MHCPQLPHPLPRLAGISLVADYIRQITRLVARLEGATTGDETASLLGAIEALANQLQNESNAVYADLHEKLAGPPEEHQSRGRGIADFERFSGGAGLVAAAR